MKKILSAIILLFLYSPIFALLSTPMLTSPANGSLYQAPNVLLDWSSVAGATNYEYKLGTDPGLAGVTVLSAGGISQAGTANLLFGTVYYWQVRAIKNTTPVDSSLWSSVWSFTTTDQVILTSPLSGALFIEPDILLDWTGISGITNYDYQYDTVSTFNSPHSYYASVGATSQVYTGNLLFGTKYYWRARSRHSADTTQWSSTWEFTTVDQVSLISPTNGAIYIAPDILLDWTGISGITNYDFQYDTVSTFNSPHSYYASVGATSQVYTGNLLFGTKYYWRARSRHSADTTQWSSTWEFTTVDQVSLISPTNGAIYIAPDILLDWTGISGITNYDFQYDTVSTFNSPHSYYASVGATSQVYTGNLLFGTKYYWRARSRHSADTTQWSSTWEFTTVDQVSLISPTNGAIYIAPDILLDWTGISGITNYDFQYDTVSTFNSPHSYYASVGATSQVYTGNLLFGTKYYWRARARHSADTTQWSSTWEFTTADQISLISPTNGAIYIAPDILLDWTGISGITNYDYQYDTVSTFNSPHSYYASVGATSQVYTGNLLFGTKYYWRARARHAADTTQWSAVWDFTTIEFLTHFSPANNAMNISLNPLIDWSGISGITGYQYRYSTNINFSNPSTFSIGAISQANLVTLSYGTQYFWQVRTFHALDTSEWSLPWSFTTIYQITGAPSLISPANSATNIPFTGATLQWASVASATVYEYEYDDNPFFISPVINTTSSLNTLTGSLLNNATYYWKVRAGNSSGFSPWSVFWAFTTTVTSGVADPDIAGLLNIYPNPSHGIIRFSIPVNADQVEVLNAQGQIVAVFENKMPEPEIDLSSQPKGIYLLKARVDKKIYISKFVIN